VFYLRKEKEQTQMSNENHVPTEQQMNPEGTTNGDPSIGEEGIDKVLLRVEGQNEHISEPPKDVEEDIAEVASALDGTTMGIEDAS
jgi:hypothetical protein